MFVRGLSRWISHFRLIARGSPYLGEPLTCTKSGLTFLVVSWLSFAPAKRKYKPVHLVQQIHSLKLTYPLKIGHPKRKWSYSNHPFWGAKMLVSWRVYPYNPQESCRLNLATHNNNNNPITLYDRLMTNIIRRIVSIPTTSKSQSSLMWNTLINP